MMENLPLFVPLAFIITTLATALLFLYAVYKSKPEKKHLLPITAVLLFLWLTVQALLSISNFYKPEKAVFPPKIVLMGILPAIFTLVMVFLTGTGKKFIDALSLRELTLIHLIRLPVEIVLYGLFLNKAIPELMTFEGRNYDILIGITAPFLALWGFKNYKIGRRLLLIWNFLGLGLLFHIVFLALLSTPSPVQKFAFEQPNIAIFYFPFSWLPTVVVPLVLFSHLASIRKILKQHYKIHESN